MKIFTSAQIKELDKYTIENEPISSINLMERAAQTMARAITEVWGTATPVVVFAGPGNNGGDALAVARMPICSRSVDICQQTALPTRSCWKTISTSSSS